MQFIPFVHALYPFESPLFYNHCNCEGNITIILFAMGICQGDALGRALFALAHFRALHSIVSHFPSRLFPAIVDDTHIVSFLSIVSSTYEHFQTKLHVISLFIQLHKCVAWSPFCLLFDFNTPSQFTTPSKRIRILGIPLGTSSFTSSFIKNALLEDVWHVDFLPRMGDV